MPYLEFIAALGGAATMVVIIFNESTDATDRTALSARIGWAIVIPCALLLLGFAATLIRLWRMF